MRATQTWVAVVVAGALVGSAQADVVSSFPVGSGTWGGGPGESNSDLTFIAQTFRALDGPATQAQFAFSYDTASEDSALEFRMLLTETSGDASGGFNPTDFKPTTILFESQPLSLAQGSVDELFTIGLGGLNLTAGQYYALVLDPLTDRDDLVGKGHGHAGSVPVDGGLYSHSGSPSLARSNHLAGTWFSFSGMDMPFSVAFVPEPTSAALLGLCSAGLLCHRRRRPAGVREGGA